MARRSDNRHETVACGNSSCARSDLAFKAYACGSPGEHVELERIHWRAYPAIRWQHSALHLWPFHCFLQSR